MTKKKFIELSKEEQHRLHNTVQNLRRRNMSMHEVADVIGLSQEDVALNLWFGINPNEKDELSIASKVFVKHVNKDERKFYRKNFLRAFDIMRRLEEEFTSMRFVPDSNKELNEMRQILNLRYPKRKRKSRKGVG